MTQFGTSWRNPVSPLVALVLLAMGQPALAVDNPEACRTLTRTMLTAANQRHADLVGPIGIEINAADLTTQTAFLNWSAAPARADLPLRGDQIEVTTCWFVTPAGQTCMVGFAREAEAHRRDRTILNIQPLGSEPCADD